MNDSLIKQLELAIQVEKGEVDLGEVQFRTRQNGEWKPTGMLPIHWQHSQCEYRRKPKPLECWFLIYIDQSAKLFTSMEGAERARDKEKNSYLPPTKIVHMKEVL